MIKILIVEDEINIARLLELGLKRKGYDTTYILNGREAADLIEERDFDLVLLDVMLPEIDGYEILTYLTALKIPVIFITAKAEIEDKIKGLKMGADDYITKPFNMDEVEVRVEALLRRCNKISGEITFKDIKINTNRREILKSGEEIILTSKEYDLLLALVQNKNKLLYREDLFYKVWNREFTGDSRTLDLHIQRLRKKLNDKNIIKSIYGVGYILNEG